MPPTTRRTRGAPPAKGAQSTLSFNGAATRITKHTGPAGKDLKKAEPAKLAAVAPKTDVIDLDRPAAVVEAEAREADAAPAQVQIPAAASVSALTPEEEEADRVPHSQVLRYWKAREADRLAPRVHQEGLSTEEKILRYFDMCSQYGPCVGIPRRKRWLRAHRLGLGPPIEALAVLVKEDKKGTPGIEKAQLEELLETIGGATEED
ncbi:hypothetical protein V496_07762 [Pseudogymnoascus sp. VKM F-4515 (FW-2607)]|nr:hypothetical protein V496_07762 [Pseudogymnoascus sp. VKM F-4515 (FW-2607)]KFY98734.1 hypothetical protein V498_01264 [Pseudogymnoascus sp. VKM F-4517 (FW-2822)]